MSEYVPAWLNDWLNTRVETTNLGLFFTVIIIILLSKLFYAIGRCIDRKLLKKSP